MCGYLSALVLRSGEVIQHEATDSHEDLVEWQNLKDESVVDKKFVRVEYTPKDFNDLADIDKYELRLDENEAPGWWDEEMQSNTERKLKAIAERRIVTEKRGVLLGGCWVIAGSAQIAKVYSSRVIAVYGSATIRNVYGSATIGDVFGSATIECVFGSATIGDVYDSATIECVFGSATIVTDHRKKKTEGGE